MVSRVAQITRIQPNSTCKIGHSISKNGINASDLQTVAGTFRFREPQGASRLNQGSDPLEEQPASRGSYFATHTGG